MDGVERALSRAQAAADALIGINNGRTAAQAAGGLGTHLFLGKRLHILAEGCRLGSSSILGRRDLALSGVVARKVGVVLVELNVLALVATDGKRSVLDKAMDRHSGFVARGDGVNGKLGTGIDIATHKDVGLRGLVRLWIGNGTLTAAELDGRTL